jgi:hypothetical protein
METSTPTKLEIGYAGDSSLRVYVDLISMTDKTATIRIGNKIKRCKIYTIPVYNRRYILPYGKFSKAPVCEL